MAFTKRSHRPWKTDLLEDTIRGSDDPLHREEILSPSFESGHRSEKNTIAEEITAIPALETALRPSKYAISEETMAGSVPPAPGRPWSSDLHGEFTHSLITDLETPDSLQRVQDQMNGFSFNIPLQENNLEIKLPSASLESNALLLENNDEGVMDESHLKQINHQLKTIISEKEQEKDEIMRRIADKKTSSPFLIGGLDPRQVCFDPNESDHGKEIKRSLHELESREDQLKLLSTNLKLLQAAEKVDEAELNRRHSEELRRAAEEKMRQIMEQANKANEQLRHAIGYARTAEEAQKLEAEARLKAEDTIQHAQNIAKQAERTAEVAEQTRLAAEKQAERAVQDAVHANIEREEAIRNRKLLEAKLSSAIEQLSKMDLARKTEETTRISAEKIMQETLLKLDKTQNQAKTDRANMEGAHAKALEEMQNSFNTQKAELLQAYSEEKQTLKTEHEAILEAFSNKFEAEIKQERLQLTEKIDRINEEKSKLESQLEKLQTIIATEQELRQLAESRSKQDKDQLKRAEHLRKEAEQKAKIMDERAKRAIEHANQTVLNFLHSPATTSLGSSTSNPPPADEENT